MPNRYIREGIITSEAVCSLTFTEEVFYRRLQNKVDDYGRFTAHPSLLRAALYPLQLGKVREADIPRWIAACEKAGLLFAYQTAGKGYLVLNKWEKGRAVSSQYPDPPEEVRKQLEQRDFIASGAKFPSCPKLGAYALDSDSDSDSGGRSRASPPNGNKKGKSLSSAQLITRETELNRVESAMKRLKDSYDSHSTWSPDDRKRFNELKVRKGELLEILEMKA